MNVSAIASLEFITRLTIFLSLTLLATRMLRRKHPVVAATVHDYVLLGLLALPILAACGFSIRCGVLPPVHTPAQQALDQPTSRARQASAPLTNTRRLEIPDSGEHRATLATPGVRKGPAAAPNGEEPIASSHGAPARLTGLPEITRNRHPAFTAWGIVVTVYFCGLTLLLARIAAGLTLLRRLVSQSSPVTTTEWLADLVHAQNTLGLQRPVRTLRSDFVTTPMTLIRNGAVILIPSELENTATAEQRAAVILHELVHIERSDFLWQMLLRTVEAIYWFHPLQWLLSRQTASTRELVCDAICARQLGTPRYASALIELAGRLKKSSLPVVGLAMARTSRLRRRLVSLYRVRLDLRHRPSRAQITVVATLIGAIVFGAGALTPLAAVAQRAASTPRQSTAQPQSRSSDAATNGGLGDLNRSRLVEKSARVLDPNGKPVVKAVVTIIAAGG